jgi:ParB family chromosome partitioning protein
MDEDALQELTSSVKASGVLQPIIVRADGDAYELVAGERRWRAAAAAGLETIPAIVMDLSDGQALEVALVENLQREDLNPLEEAKAYELLRSAFGMKQEEIAQRVGKERSTVANSLRLLRLSLTFQEDVLAGRLTMGHARALLGLKGDTNRRRLRDLIVRRGLSVRQAEGWVQRSQSRQPPRRRAADPFVSDVEARLETALSTRVRLHHRRGRGRIRIDYFSLEELDRLIALLTRR